MSELGEQVLASLQEAIDAMESGEPLPSSAWYATEIVCQGCGDGRVIRRDRTEPDGLFETTFVCRDCNSAFWLERESNG